MDHEAFWRQTPRLIETVLAGVGERLRREHNERVAQAYMTAKFSRAEKLAKLDRYLAKAPAHARRRQTVEEQIAVAQAWTAAVNRKR